MDDTPPLTQELKAYRALLSTASAIHRNDFESISTKVALALEKIKEVPKITSELREEVRLLKIGVDSQNIRAAGAKIPTHHIQSVSVPSLALHLFLILIARSFDLICFTFNFFVMSLFSSRFSRLSLSAHFALY